MQFQVATYSLPPRIVCPDKDILSFETALPCLPEATMMQLFRMQVITGH